MFFFYLNIHGLHLQFANCATGKSSQNGFGKKRVRWLFWSWKNDLFGTHFQAASKVVHPVISICSDVQFRLHQYFFSLPAKLICLKRICLIGSVNVKIRVWSNNYFWKSDTCDLFGAIISTKTWRGNVFGIKIKSVLRIGGFLEKFWKNFLPPGKMICSEKLSKSQIFDMLMEKTNTFSPNRFVVCFCTGRTMASRWWKSTSNILRQTLATNIWIFYQLWIKPLYFPDIRCSLLIKLEKSLNNM